MKWRHNEISRTTASPTVETKMSCLTKVFTFFTSWQLQSLFRKSSPGHSSVFPLHSRLLRQLQAVVAATRSLYADSEDGAKNTSIIVQQITSRRRGTHIQMFLSLGSSHSITADGSSISFIIHSLIFPTACQLMSHWVISPCTCWQRIMREKKYIYIQVYKPTGENLFCPCVFFFKTVYFVTLFSITDSVQLEHIFHFFSTVSVCAHSCVCARVRVCVCARVVSRDPKSHCCLFLILSLDCWIWMLLSALHEFDINFSFPAGRVPPG